jgi:hypothetical protein
MGEGMRSWSLLIATAVTLTGCANAGQLAANDDDKCQSYGFAPGTQGYAQCRMSMDASRQQAASAAIAGLANGMRSVGNAYANMPVQRPIQCNTIALGGGMSTSTCQ